MTPTPEAAVHRGDPNSPGYLRSSEEWATLLDARIVDPDGWRGVRAANVFGAGAPFRELSFEEAWAQLITREVFDRRYAESTVDPRGRKAWLESQQLTADIVGGPASALSLEGRRLEHEEQSGDTTRDPEPGIRGWRCILTPSEAEWTWHVAGPCSEDPRLHPPSFEVPKREGLIDHFQRGGFPRAWDDGADRNGNGPVSPEVGRPFADPERPTRAELGLPPLKSGPAAVRERDKAWALEQRFDAARQALHQTGYWKRDEVGLDLAPRILELGSKLTDLEGRLEATQIQLERALGVADPDRLTREELDQLPTLDVSGVNMLAVDVKAQRRSWEREVLVEFLEHLPADGAQAVDYIAVLSGAMLKARP